MKLEFSRPIFERSSNIKFYEIPSSGGRVIQRGRTDRHDEAKSRFSQIFRTRLKKAQRMTSLSESSNALWWKATRSQVIGCFWTPLARYGSDKRHYSATTHAERVLFRFV